MTTNEPWISDARLFAEVTRAKVGGPIYVIGGPREARLTIHSQQCRAINLVCALRELERDLHDMEIAVIGAGAAGMTAASALRAVGVPERNLTIYERAASPLYTQRWSYTRFLHPRLFHWPEAGWENGEAGLPLADWCAGYAAAVRERILTTCSALPIKFCTDVQCVAPSGSRARVTFCPLHYRWAKAKDFDLVLVASGFPTEPKVANTIGGTYWHALDSLDDLTGDVHVVGDGDGALTEVLMILINRFGHAVIERLCERLPLAHVDRLHAADLEAQGNPSQRAEVRPQDVESHPIMTLFRLLSRTRQRSVFIHAKDPLSGSSFLLNRALVSHLTWGSDPMVRLQAGPKIAPANAASLGTSVIWRAGVGGVSSKPSIEARVTTKGLIAALQPAGFIGPYDVGLLTGLLDGLRRPMWTESARRILVPAVAPGGMGWTEPDVKTLYPVSGRPTSEAEELLMIVVATEIHLKRIGLPECETVSFDEARWVSIDVLARVGSCPHADLVQPGPVNVSLRWDLTRPRRTPAAPRSALRRDEHDRLWFRLPDNPGDLRPTRAAVCAILAPPSLHEWARRQSTRDSAVRPSRGHRWFANETSSEVLHGLGDIAGTNVRTKLLLASAHQERGDWEATRGAYLRAGREPAGKLTGARRHPERPAPKVNVAFRRVLLGLGAAISRMRPGDPDAAEHASWLMLAAAGANLVTLTASDDPILELRTTPTFLSDVWAPRVRVVLTPPGTRAVDLARVPDWANALANAAIKLRGPERVGVRPTFDAIQTLAGAAAGYAEVETPSEPLITLSEFGVWTAGTAVDRELRNSFRSSPQEPPTAT